MGLFGFGTPDIGKLAHKKDINGLIKAFGHEDYHIRAEAAKQFLWIRPTPSAVQPLIALLSDPCIEVRTRAVDALSQSNDPRVVGPLFEAAFRDSASEVSCAAVEALSKRRDDRMVEALTALLKDKTWNVRSYSAYILGEMGKRDHVTGHGGMGVLSGRAIKPLIDTLNDSDSRVRDSAADALVSIGGLRTVDLLTAEHNNPDSKVREEADRVLTRIKANRDMG